VKGHEFVEKVKNEVGFTLFPVTYPAYGVQAYSGVILVCDLNGEILRKATAADIQKWQTVWEKLIKEVTETPKVA
jgi:hypothetical protein